LQAEKTRSSVVAKILGNTSEEEPREAMKDSRPAIPTPMLDFALRGGRIVSLSYAYLTKVIFEPSGRLELHFGDDVVVIEGRNLRETRQKIRLHKANEIQEGMEAEGVLKPEESAHVERIQIWNEKELRREAMRETRRHKSIER
jgi:hypothetical protein